ncbi:DUF4376 domain-containing protein [Sutterella sp.]|uniref:DUF4376 domain-containing protein n=1 Tax=Sutterella sp. TaxID=1981025 RepID=UPI0026E02C79|nr:DUF4376 domain-containing protein [Sutterella sp.]MDO5531435.1 DUF4376 domain-containing protein [Sutterella sp.]
MSSSIKELPRLDADGYYDGVVACMTGSDGKLQLAASAVNADPPEQDGLHFYKYDEESNGWTAEAIPTSAAECVGITLPHASRTARVQKLRALFRAFTDGSSTHRLVQDATTLALTVEAIPEKTVDELRSEKKAELSRAFSTWYDSDATAVSSLGWRIDADSDAKANVDELVLRLTAAAEGTTDTFRDADNALQTVTLANAQTMQLEIAEARRAALDHKWELGAAIDAAADAAALEAIEIVFAERDFTAAEEETE